MSIVAVIPARGGSKGLPRKNLRMLAGRPLLAWTVDAACACREISRIILSTDDEEIAAVGRALGCEVPFLRPAALAGDHTPAIDVAVHLVAALGERMDYLVWLQPTSPLRTADDIRGCLALAQGENSASVSVVRATESPFWMFTMSPSARLDPIVPPDKIPLRRQDLPPAFRINGAVYVAETKWLVRQHSFLGDGVYGFEMPAERSIDIDTAEELELAERHLLKE